MAGSTGPLSHISLIDLWFGKGINDNHVRIIFLATHGNKSSFFGGDKRVK